MFQHLGGLQLCTIALSHLAATIEDDEVIGQAFGEIEILFHQHNGHVLRSRSNAMTRSMSLMMEG